MTLFNGMVGVLDTETTGFPGQPWSAVCDLAVVLVEMQRRWFMRRAG